jgi:hypothetical protein
LNSNWFLKVKPGSGESQFSIIKQVLVMGIFENPVAIQFFIQGGRVLQIIIHIYPTVAGFHGSPLVNDQITGLSMVLLP